MFEDFIKFFESIEKLIEKLGLKEQTANKIVTTLLFVIVLIGLVKILRDLILYFILRFNQRILGKDLTPFYTRSDVDRATRYYIATKYQNVSPSEDEEPGREYIASAKNKIIPLFLKKVFINGASDVKYYLILADTGMGKTTFMINLYIRYKNKFSLLSNNKLEICLYPLGDPNTIERIKKKQNKERTILLLDAFDEDIYAIDRHKERMFEILKEIEEFKYIVITCRTQFFPSNEEEPTTTGYFNFGDNGREYKFQKLYLSVFDENDIRKYLGKKFHFRFSNNYKKAYEIVRNCPNLVVRPMLLSRIDELITSDISYEFSYQIYEVLIQNWITRESNKPAIILKYKNAEVYQKLLYDFSYELAHDMYVNRKKRGGYFIKSNENIISDLGIQISEIDENYKNINSEIKGKSLLNRTSKGEYKFSHKSIFEYFLSISLIKDIVFLSNFDFDGMNATEMFFKQMSINILRKIHGTFSIYSSSEISKKSVFDELNYMSVGKILKDLEYMSLSSNMLPSRYTRGEIKSSTVPKSNFSIDRYLENIDYQSYLSIEMFNGKIIIDEKDELFSLGKVDNYNIRNIKHVYLDNYQELKDKINTFGSILHIRRIFILEKPDFLILLNEIRIVVMFSRIVELINIKIIGVCIDYIKNKKIFIDDDFHYHTKENLYDYLIYHAFKTCIAEIGNFKFLEMPNEFTDYIFVDPINIKNKNFIKYVYIYDELIQNEYQLDKFPSPDIFKYETSDSVFINGINIMAYKSRIKDMNISNIIDLWLIKMNNNMTNERRIDIFFNCDEYCKTFISLKKILPFLQIFVN